MLPMRPRFELELPCDAKELLDRMQQRLACGRCPCRLTVVGRHVEVDVHERIRHFWSPRLSLELEPRDGAETILRGLFGPNANVWTLFMAAYAFTALSAMFSGVFGLVQLGLGQSPWGLAIAGAAVLAALLPYGGSLVGQRLAADQMELLRCFLLASLGQPHERAKLDLCPPAPAPLAVSEPRRLPTA